MIEEKQEKCLQLRNQTTRQDETYCKCYTKKFSGYFRHILINYKSVGLVILMLIISLLIVFTDNAQEEKNLSSYIEYIILGTTVFFWIYEIIKGLWFWKYAKHVVVTNEGIWIMWCSIFWRKKDFAGKKRLLSPRWSMYGWNEIKITDNDKVRPRSPVKLANFFDDFDYAVIKSSRLTSLFMTRWDGMEEIDFLDEADANEILAYAREQRKRKKPKKKDTEIIEDDHDKLSDEELMPEDED